MHNKMIDIPSIYYGGNFFILITQYLKTLMSKVGSCDFKKLVGSATNRNKFNNN